MLIVLRSSRTLGQPAAWSKIVHLSSAPGLSDVDTDIALTTHTHTNTHVHTHINTQTQYLFTYTIHVTSYTPISSTQTHHIAVPASGTWPWLLSPNLLAHPHRPHSHVSVQIWNTDACSLEAAPRGAHLLPHRPAWTPGLQPAKASRKQRTMEDCSQSFLFGEPGTPHPIWRCVASPPAGIF